MKRAPWMYAVRTIAVAILAILLVSAAVVAAVHWFTHGGATPDQYAAWTAPLFSGGLVHVVYRTRAVLACAVSATIHQLEQINMDTPDQAMASAGAALTAANTKLNASAAHLSTIATAVQGVESLAAQSLQATGTAPSSEQKLAAAVQMASVLDPSVGQLVTPAAALVSSVVSIFNMFGLFGHRPTT